MMKRGQGTKATKHEASEERRRAEVVCPRDMGGPFRAREKPIEVYRGRGKVLSGQRGHGGGSNYQWHPAMGPGSV